MAETTKYKLTYFNARGRAEVIRWMFEVSGVQYEDYRLPREKWFETKTAMPFGQLPVLEVDGVQIAQTAAICRYLASQFGLEPSTPLEKARGDMIVDAVNDFWMPFSAVIRLHMVPEAQRNQQTIAEMIARLRDETVPQYLSYFERALKVISGGESFFVGDKMTWIDMYLTNYMANLTMAGKSMLGLDINLDEYPKLQALINRVDNHPKIADWVKRRPATPR